MSIKLKIALYNTFLVSFVMILVLVFMMSISNSVLSAGTLSQLKYMVRENAEEVEWKGSKLDLDDINLYDNHISTLVYSQDGFHLLGYTAHIEELSQIPLTHGVEASIQVDGVEYLLYDFYVEERGEGVYLRGVASVLEVSATVETLFFLTLLALPVFILLAGLGSYGIAKKSMKPLEKIIDTAQDISHGDDLSRRIALSGGKDEIHHLAETFDTMFSQLEQAFLSEKRFSSDVSHELRTPTAVILAECECSLKGEPSSEELREALSSVQRQGKKMQQLITALLNLTRLDNGVHKANFQEVDFSELVLLVCEEQESLLEMSQGACRLETEVPSGIVCQMDYGMMIRVLSNLLDNGVKYGKEGGCVRVTLAEEGDFVSLQVADDGIGIAKEHLPFLFHRLYQVDPSRNSQNSHSMGLGLSMVEQIVKLHHGTISVESTVGQGTCFTVRLPSHSEQKGDRA